MIIGRASDIVVVEEVQYSGVREAGEQSEGRRMRAGICWYRIGLGRSKGRQL